MLFASSAASNFKSLSLVFVCLRAEQSSENSNGLLMDKLLHGCLLACLRRNAYFEISDKPLIPAAENRGVHWIF